MAGPRALLSNGSINFTSGLNTVGNYTVNIICWNYLGNSSQLVRINVTNNAPVVLTVSLNTLPAQAGSPLNISFTCSDPDNDACNATRYYAWFKNGVQLKTTNHSLAPGYFTTGDNITGAVKVSDTLLNSTWLNTSVATIGDTTLPVITGYNVTPLVTTTAGTVTITANCTDNNQIGAVYAEVTDANSVKANFSMSNNSDSYSYAYPPPVAGTYSIRVFCTDGNWNAANTSSSVFTATQFLPSSSGGSSGGYPAPFTSS